MPRKAKTVDNLERHATKAEIAQREAAEQELLCGAGALDPAAVPALIGDDQAAVAYWQSIIARAQDVLIMDTLDAEILSVYCSQLSRRDAMIAQLREEPSALIRTKLEDAIQKIEKTLLGYAKELGLTPSARVGLAKKRAAQEEDDPTADLFG